MFAESNQMQSQEKEKERKIKRDMEKIRGEGNEGSRVDMETGAEMAQDKQQWRFTSVHGYGLMCI